MTVSERTKFDWKVTAFLAACAVSWGVIYQKVEGLNEATSEIAARQETMAALQADTSEDVAVIKALLKQGNNPLTIRN